MFAKFFGVPQLVIRSGIWAKMKPTEQSLYICVLHESERYRNRELRRTDAQLRLLTGLSSRSFCNARKKLGERGLVLCKRGSGNVYIYTLCNPETGHPWPGDPKRPVAYIKKSDQLAATNTVPQAMTELSTNPLNRGVYSQNVRLATTDNEPKAEAHGVPISFS